MSGNILILILISIIFIRGISWSASTRKLGKTSVSWSSIFHVAGWASPLTHLHGTSFFFLCYAGSHCNHSCLAVIKKFPIITHAFLMVHCWLIISDLLSHWLPLQLLMHSCCPSFTYISGCTALFRRRWGYFLYVIIRDLKYSLCYPLGKLSISSVISYIYQWGGIECLCIHFGWLYVSLSYALRAE